LSFGQKTNQASKLTQSATQTLRLAQSVYEQGRLHELPSLPGMSDNDIKGYTKPEQVTAYRLLTLAHIYLEEPEEADKTMLKLLDADHFYQPNDKVEPAEFMGLYKTFRTTPVFNIGLKFGVNSTIPLLQSIYYTSNTPGGGKYTPKIGFQFGLSFEKEFFQRKKGWLKKVVFAPEIFYTQRTFSYANSQPYTNDVTPNTSDGSQSVIVKQNWIDINPILQFKLRHSINFVPYVGFGPGVSYMLSGANTMVSNWKNINGVPNGSVNGPDIDYTKSYHKLVPSVIALAGVKYRFNSIYLVAEFRAQYGLANPVNNSSRSNYSGVFDYSYQLPNYKPANFTVNLGFVYPYFKPMKLKRK
jgi:hypothetical protein